jgi:hypothetical protein
MTPSFLSLGQSQLLAHVMAWGNLRIAEITAGAFAQTQALPSVAALRYLERVKGHEARLLSSLGVDPIELEKEVTRPDGSSLNHYLWVRSPAWLGRELSGIGRIVVDDLWQVRQGRTNVHDRVLRWKKVFGAQENARSRLNVAGLSENLVWLQQTYSLRHSFAEDLVRKTHHGWDLVLAFYDPAARAAQNILEGGLALQHYLKVKPPSV